MMCRDNSTIDYRFKVALIGDSNTGKSTLLRRLIEKDTFKFYDCNNNDFISNTIGVDFKREDFILEKSNVKVSLNFFDTSGDNKYNFITFSYIENVQAFIITYDVQNMQSFQNCQYWLDEILKRQDTGRENGNLNLLGIWAHNLFYDHNFIFRKQKEM